MHVLNEKGVVYISLLPLAPGKGRGRSTCPFAGVFGAFHRGQGVFFQVFPEINIGKGNQVKLREHLSAGSWFYFFFKSMRKLKKKKVQTLYCINSLSFSF